MTAVGLTWDHPRGRNALVAAAERANAGRAAPLIRWQTQPLEGFESAPIADLAARHDVLVLDHPHIGEAVAEDCLTPLDDLYPADRIAAWETQSVGPAFRSYRWAGRHWALPLDVAHQVMAWRPDRADAPADWDEVIALARGLPVAQSLGGPHALLTLISLAAGRGASVGDDFLSDEAGAAALAVMHRLYALRPPGSEALNPIALLEAAAGSDEIALIPLIFGYVTYARSGDRRRALAFADAIRARGGDGGVLGGTGIAITRRARPDAGLLGHLAWLMEPTTQAGFVPDHDGQPSARGAWRNEAVNAAWGNFYAGTLASAEDATLRPRFDGWVAFQTEAAARVRAALEAREDEAATLAALRNLWAGARDRARGPLDDKDDIT